MPTFTRADIEAVAQRCEAHLHLLPRHSERQDMLTLVRIVRTFIAAGYSVGSITLEVRSVTVDLLENGEV
jgi:hypothetical protein